MRRWIVVAAALAIGGCGSQSESARLAQQDRDAKASQRTAEAALTRAERATARAGDAAVRDARAACSVFSRAKMAHDLGITSKQPADLAARYARGYDPSIRARVEASCLRGILSR